MYINNILYCIIIFHEYCMNSRFINMFSLFFFSLFRYRYVHNHLSLLFFRNRKRIRWSFLIKTNATVARVVVSKYVVFIHFESTIKKEMKFICNFVEPNQNKRDKYVPITHRVLTNSPLLFNWQQLISVYWSKCMASIRHFQRFYWI